MLIQLIVTKVWGGGKCERLVEKEGVSRCGKKTREDTGMNVAKRYHMYTDKLSICNLLRIPER